MALYGQSADGIREDLGLLTLRIEALEKAAGGSTTKTPAAATKPAVKPAPPVTNPTAGTKAP